MIRKFLRRFFNCWVLGHEWVAGHSAVVYSRNKVITWDSRSWKCRLCPQWSYTDNMSQRPDEGRFCLLVDGALVLGVAGR